MFTNRVWSLLHPSQVFMFFGSTWPIICVPRNLPCLARVCRAAGLTHQTLQTHHSFPNTSQCPPPTKYWTCVQFLAPLVSWSPVTVVPGGRGWTSSKPGHLHTALHVCRAHGDVTHGGLGGFVSCPYFFPQHCMPYRLSVGTGLFTNAFFWIGNKNKWESHPPQVHYDV